MQVFRVLWDKTHVNHPKEVFREWKYLSLERFDIWVWMKMDKGRPANTEFSFSWIRLSLQNSSKFKKLSETFSNQLLGGIKASNINFDMSNPAIFIKQRIAPSPKKYFF